MITNLLQLIDGQNIQIEQAIVTRFGEYPLNSPAPDFVLEAKILPEMLEREKPTVPVPIYFNGVLVSDVVSDVNYYAYHVVELSDKTPTGPDYPSTFVDSVADLFVRDTYQKPDGMNKSGNYGTSFAATFSYRPATGDLQYIPTVDRADITIGGADRYTDVVTGHFVGSVANITSTRTFPEDPTFGFTTVGVSNVLAVQQDVELATGDLGTTGDVLRAGTLSSMFFSPQQFDASLILWEDRAGNVHSLQLSDATPRDKHLFDKPQELGSWVELVKGAGSTWFPNSPTIRLMISDPHGLQLGLQGFLASSKDPNEDPCNEENEDPWDPCNEDSLTVWTEVLNPPSTLAQGTNYKVDFEVIAVPPLLDSDIVPDFNGNSSQDILYQSTVPVGTLGSWNIFLDTGTRQFEVFNPNLNTPGLIASAIGDFDGDNLLDILYYDSTNGTNFTYSPNESQPWDFLRDPNNRDAPLQTPGLSPVAAIDLNFDGTDELLFYNESNGLNISYNPTTRQFDLITGVGSGGVTTDRPFAVGNVDGDGAPEVIYAEPSSGRIRIFNTDTNTFEPLNPNDSNQIVPGFLPIGTLNASATEPNLILFQNQTTGQTALFDRTLGSFTEFLATTPNFIGVA